VSSNLAFAAPLASPREQEHPRHIEIVSSREQRKARPRTVYAAVTIAGLFAIFLAQLLLSIVVSDGAYRIAGLQTDQRDLTRQEQALNEQLDLLASPQNLATQAESLGMTLGDTAPVYLRLSDGAVLGPETAAGTGAAVVAGGSLVANSLLGDVPLVTPAAVDPVVDPATAATTATDGAPTTTTTGESVASTPMALPSPVTH
jgi:hypothetical protein